eukprot:806657-Karenia_brevis.AAC.1
MSDGSYLTCPSDVDKLLCDTWDDVYQGNCTNMSSTMSAYLDKYRNFLYTSQPVAVHTITCQDVYTTVQEASKTSPGMDAWSYADWQLLPSVAFQTIALIYSLVESGSPWPGSALHTKSHPLCKDPSNPYLPLAFRFLLLTPILYRVWAKTRLRQLKHWVDGWRLPQMYGGMPGMGSEDAWYITAIQAEHDVLYDVPH